MTLNKIKTPTSDPSIENISPEVGALVIPPLVRVIQDSISILHESGGFQSHSATLYGDGNEFEVVWIERLGSPLITGNPLATLMCPGNPPAG